MLKYEADYHAQGYTAIAGVDEVGRGPLAGPVLACAVILPPGLIIEGVTDSKKLSEKRREALAQIIKEKAITWAYAMVSPEEIDEINILQATMKAMATAVKEISPDFALIDGNKLPQDLPCPGVAIKKGDMHSHSIAAASILAKVARDGMMQDMDALYPQYGFAKHKGYGTKGHMAAIHAHGLTAIHRRSFCKKFDLSP